MGRAAVRRVDDMYKPRRERKRGHPSAMTGIRYPQELLPIVEQAGRDRTDGAIRLLDLAADAMAEVTKELWIEIEVYAVREGILEGQALGRLAKLGLEALQKGGKR